MHDQSTHIICIGKFPNPLSAEREKSPLIYEFVIGNRLSVWNSAWMSGDPFCPYEWNTKEVLNLKSISALCWLVISANIDKRLLLFQSKRRIFAFCFLSNVADNSFI